MLTGIPFGDTVSESVLSQFPSPFVRLIIVDYSGSKYGPTVLGSIVTSKSISSIMPYYSRDTNNIISVVPK